MTDPWIGHMSPDDRARAVLRAMRYHPSGVYSPYGVSLDLPDLRKAVADAIRDAEHHAQLAASARPAAEGE